MPQPSPGICGLKVRDDGELQHSARATTLSEVAKMVNRFRSELQRRETHSEVIHYCREEILRKTYSMPYSKLPRDSPNGSDP